MRRRIMATALETVKAKAAAVDIDKLRDESVDFGKVKLAKLKEAASSIDVNKLKEAAAAMLLSASAKGGPTPRTGGHDNAPAGGAVIE